MARAFVAANWKMNTTLAEAERLVEAMKDALSAIEGVEKVVCPPFISLARVCDLLRGTPVKVGAQNMYFQDKGAFTGEVSPLMLQGLCQYVILGHSERRHLFGEGDELVARKVVAALRHGLAPILCVGELLEERDAGRAHEVVERQVRAALAGVSAPGELVMAYEPVWAIGTGRPATSQDAAEMMEHIRRLLVDQMGRGAGAVPLLYGGSVTAANIREFADEPPIDGALVGGASLKPAEFVEIVRQVAEARAGR